MLITTNTRIVGLIAAVCAVIVAPQALAASTMIVPPDADQRRTSRRSSANRSATRSGSFSSTRWNGAGAGPEAKGAHRVPPLQSDADVSDCRPRTGVQDRGAAARRDRPSVDDPIAHMQIREDKGIRPAASA